MILLLLLVEVMVLCLFYLIYRQLLIQLIMIIFFCILENSVGICGNALKLIKSYFSNRTQRVQIDDVLSDFVNIICGVPQRSVLGPLKSCLYLLPMSAILKYHKIGYHVYADDTELYISFKCKQILESVLQVNSCLSGIRRWMITKKLKIIDSKTEFIGLYLHN